MKIEFSPIGYIKTSFRSPAEAPPTSRANDEIGEIHLEAKYVDGLKNMEGFSHLMVVFHFHRQPGDYELVISPRPRPDLKVGLFTTHSPRRPNSIGVSIVEIVRVENNVVYFKGVDMIDGTPVLDLKTVGGDIKITRSGWLAEGIHD